MKLLTTLICLISALEIASGQPMDSIGFSKARLQAGKYVLNRFGISKIKIKNKGPSPATDDGISTDEKIIEGAFTFLFGFSTSSSSETMWLLNNHIKLTGIERKIEFPVLVRGFFEKSRERVRNDDGSSSMETMERYILYWDQGADGAIIVDGTSLGDFSLACGSMANDSIEYYKSLIEQIYPSPSEQKVNTVGNYHNPEDFFVNVLFEGIRYTIVYDDNNHRFTLIENGQIVGLWQNVSGNRMNTIDQRIDPYLLLQEGLTNDEAQRNITLLTLGLTLDRNQLD